MPGLSGVIIIPIRTLQFATTIIIIKNPNSVYHIYYTHLNLTHKTRGQTLETKPDRSSSLEGKPDFTASFKIKAKWGSLLPNELKIGRSLLCIGAVPWQLGARTARRSRRAKAKKTIICSIVMRTVSVGKGEFFTGLPSFANDFFF